MIGSLGRRCFLVTLLQRLCCQIILTKCNIFTITFSYFHFYTLPKSLPLWLHMYTWKLKNCDLLLLIPRCDLLITSKCKYFAARYGKSCWFDEGRHYGEAMSTVQEKLKKQFLCFTQIYIPWSPVLADMAEGFLCAFIDLTHCYQRLSINSALTDCYKFLIFIFGYRLLHLNQW